MNWVRRIAKVCAVIVGLFLIWFGLGVAAMFTEPESNRDYAETWKGAPSSELLQAQGLPRETVFRPDGRMVIRYHLGPWRGMKGRTFPGSNFNAYFGPRNMESGVRFITPPIDRLRVE
jgi:hypothetical protein